VLELLEGMRCVLQSILRALGALARASRALRMHGENFYVDNFLTSDAGLTAHIDRFYVHWENTIILRENPCPPLC